MNNDNQPTVMIEVTPEVLDAIRSGVVEAMSYPTPLLHEEKLLAIGDGVREAVTKAIDNGTLLP